MFANEGILVSHCWTEIKQLQTKLKSLIKINYFISYT